MAKEKAPRILILIDGSNFYHALKKLGIKHQLSFDYTSFFTWLTNSPKYSAIYHIGEIKYNPNNPKSKILHQGQRKLFAHLTNHNISLTKGYMLKSAGKYHEKGVDVALALDIAIGAYENTYDTCYLISSDTDLIPAIKIARSKNKQVTYIGFHKSSSCAMIYNCSNKRIINQANLKPFES